MIERLKKTGEIQVQTECFINQLGTLCNSLEVYEDAVDLSALKEVQAVAYERCGELFRKGRKLQIAIMGEVKAGKSSFLNTLLFNGEEVLPKATTPKTAVLTKIEYALENALEMTYYTQDEWETITFAAQHEDGDGHEIACELLEMLDKRGVDPTPYFEKETEMIAFESSSELASVLNDYVGEDGEYTPFVKYVTLKINNEALQDITIIDTPGFSDPIISRTAQTKSFIEKCDIVFYLSKASNFLNASDVTLLTTQLPQSGVRKLVLIGSRYDSALVDTIYDFGSLEEAHEDTARRLTKHANKVIDDVIEHYKHHGAADEFIKRIEACKNPIFVSAMADNMAYKLEGMYTEEEALMCENLNVTDELTQESLTKIGNMAKVQLVFEEVIKQKEEIIQSKMASLITDTIAHMRSELSTLQDIMQKDLYFFRGSDSSEFLSQQKYIVRQVHSMQANIEEIFGELNILLEQSKIERIRELREGSKSYTILEEQVGTEVSQGVHIISNAKWYNPSSWGTRKEQTYSYEENYYYLGPAEVLENIRAFVVDATNALEDTFYQSVDLTNLKNKMLTVIVEHFDTSEESYDPMYFKLLAERALSKIELPVIRIEIAHVLDNITAKFSGEIRTATEKANLRQMLVSSISTVFDDLTTQFLEEFRIFKEKMDQTKTTFLSELVNNITGDIDRLTSQMENREAEIKKAECFINDIQAVLHHLESLEQNM